MQFEGYLIDRLRPGQVPDLIAIVSTTQCKEDTNGRLARRHEEGGRGGGIRTRDFQLPKLSGM